jgi:2-succinyl-6-hydroxy-2,4-cyclohexadiene-1-carboxylate synthase
VSAPLLLLHGFTGSPESFTRVKARLDPGRRVLVPALLGHDSSTSSTLELTFEAEVDRIAALVRGADLEGVHVLGYSLGARMALGLIVRHRALFARATLIGVNPGLDGDALRAQRALDDERWCRLIDNEGVAAFADAWQNQPLFASQARLSCDLLDEQRRIRISHDPAGLVAALRQLGLARMPSYRSSLAALDLPVTLAAGELDAKFCAIARELSQSLRAGRLVIAAGRGHNLLLEDPELIGELLADPDARPTRHEPHASAEA